MFTSNKYDADKLADKTHHRRPTKAIHRGQFRRRWWRPFYIFIVEIFISQCNKLNEGRHLIKERLGRNFLVGTIDKGASSSANINEIK